MQSKCLNVATNYIKLLIYLPILYCIQINLGISISVELTNLLHPKFWEFRAHLLLRQKHCWGSQCGLLDEADHSQSSLVWCKQKQKITTSSHSTVDWHSKRGNSGGLLYLWAWIRALNPNPFRQLLVKFCMLTPGYLKPEKKKLNSL